MQRTFLKAHIGPYLELIESLETLILPQAEITDFLFLKKCKHLSILDLSKTNFTDCSLLLSLPALKVVMLPSRNNLSHCEAMELLTADIKISEPAVDLGIMLACASSFKNISVPTDTVVIGEVGLTGEVRAVNLIDKRLKEAEKLGFKTCIIPESNKKLLKESYKLDIIGVGNIKEAIQAVGLR